MKRGYEYFEHSPAESSFTSIGTSQATVNGSNRKQENSLSAEQERAVQEARKRLEGPTGTIGGQVDTHFAVFVAGSEKIRDEKALTTFELYDFTIAGRSLKGKYGSGLENLQRDWMDKAPVREANGKPKLVR